MKAFIEVILRSYVCLSFKKKSLRLFLLKFGGLTFGFTSNSFVKSNLNQVQI